MESGEAGPDVTPIAHVPERVLRLPAETAAAPDPGILPVDLAAIVAAITSARGTFWQKIASPRFILAVAGLLTVIAMWIQNNISAPWAAGAVVAITAVATIIEGAVHVNSQNAAAKAVHLALHSPEPPA